MAIIYDGKEKTFLIHTERSTYQIKVGRYGHLLHLYYGDRTDEVMDRVIELRDRGFSGNPYDAGEDRTYSMDALPLEFPAQGTGDYRSPALALTDGRGLYGCDLRFASYEIRPGKYRLPGLPSVFSKGETGESVSTDPGASDRAQTLEIVLRSSQPDMEVSLLYGVLPACDIITRSAVIRNRGEDVITLEKALTASIDFPGPGQDLDRIIFYGRHAMERIPDRRAVGPGSYVIGSRRGFSSHQYNPVLILCDSDATEEKGRCWSMQFVYSGGFRAEVERDQYGLVRMQMGLMQERFSWPLACGEDLVVPEVIMTYSGRGLESLSQNLHTCIRDHICRFPEGFSPPVLLNSWEACYFDFTGDRIMRMAEEAADLGMDMIVLDDGWFGERSDDLRALGDWTPNEDKLGCSLAELSRRIHGLGLSFGIWMEPEMISEDSRLYREHPDWVLKIPGRDPVRSRYQLVLDLSRPHVAEGIYERICAVLDSARIEYLKWDANRHIADLYSADRPAGTVLHAYVLGLYRLLDRLRRRYPGLLIEGCCGGGGRFDAGMLYYTPQIWCSDNTDPIDRLTVQYGTSFAYPLCVMGAHVSASPNELTGRKTPLSTRAAVAMAGTFGYELDPAGLSPARKREIREQILRFREDAPLIRNGIYYRLSDPVKEGAGAWMILSRDRRQALVTIVSARETGLPLGGRLRLRGLEPGGDYRIDETGETASADHWMREGIACGETGAWAARVYHLRRIR